MSADNWALCPNCIRRADIELTNRKQEADDTYGKVTQEEYESLRAKADEAFSLGFTLREDYSQGVDEDGIYYVSYIGNCQACAFVFSYDYKADAMAVYR